MGMLAMCTIAACSDDDLGNGSGMSSGTSKDAVYMNVEVQLPGGAGSRSITQPGGGTGATEPGQDYENKVQEILLVLANKDNKFIGAGIQQSLSNISGANKISYATTQKISKSILADYYGGDGTLTPDEQEIYVYVFCNPTKHLKDTIATINTDAQKASWYNISGSVKETPTTTLTGDSIWRDNYFLMSTYNAQSAKKKLPPTLKEWDQYDSESKAFNFSGVNNQGTVQEINNTGLIPVERTAARFDLKDGSPLKGTKPRTYDVVSMNVTEGEEGNETTETKTIMQIELQKVALVNMSKNFYYLRRVSEDGQNTNATIGGIERGEDEINNKQANYVVDTDAAKKDAGFTASDYGTHFNFCLGNVSGNKWTIDQSARNQWYASDMKEILERTALNGGDYRIWRYATENTIPGASKQKQGITTGIVFKGKMIATPDAPDEIRNALDPDKITGDPQKDPILYAYSNNLYVRWTAVRKAAIAAGEATEFYTAVFGNPTSECKPSVGKGDDEPVYSDDADSPDHLWHTWQEAKGTDVDVALANFKEKVTNAKFTLYQSSNEDDNPGYFCYYYYWNRHNDNGKNNVMGPMEFGVVRNNVYKLAVTNISRLGHPRISDNDPDPVDPEDPDESGDVYFTVSVEVLPWVVRTNNIEF